MMCCSSYLLVPGGGVNENCCRCCAHANGMIASDRAAVINARMVSSLFVLLGCPGGKSEGRKAQAPSVNSPSPGVWQLIQQVGLRSNWNATFKSTGRACSSRGQCRSLLPAPCPLPPLGRYFPLGQALTCGLQRPLLAQCPRHLRVSNSDACWTRCIWSLFLSGALRGAGLPSHYCLSVR